jgi:hypothetical protein
MSTPPPAPPVQKKRGMGCLGCGCLILVVLALLLAALIGGVGYIAYAKINGLTTDHPPEIQAYDGGDDAYHAISQKLADFSQAVNQQKAATLHLNADEINTLIARNPDLKNNKIQAFVTLSDDVAEMQLSASLDNLKLSAFKGRYLYVSTKTGLDFDPQSKAVNLLIKDFQIGKETTPPDYLPMVQSQIDSALNQALQGNPSSKNALDHAKSIEIKNGELVIEAE